MPKETKWPTKGMSPMTVIVKTHAKGLNIQPTTTQHCKLSGITL